ncbi:MAG: hypothetical protein HQ591_04620 [candidate division Zixibacteria bacterium]|nr:hypothetical protein [Candidatus Tariuqbacter arcticus]
MRIVIRVGFDAVEFCQHGASHQPIGFGGHHGGFRFCIPGALFRIRYKAMGGIPVDCGREVIIIKAILVHFFQSPSFFKEIFIF